MNPKPPLDEYHQWVERWPGQVAVALSLSLLFFGVRWALDPLLGDRQPYAPAYGAVALAVWLAGWRSGVLTLVICALWGSFFFVSPRGTFHLGASELVGLATYVFIAAIIVWLGNAARSANRALREADFIKDHFLATLSHELRNPLSPIVNGLLLLRANRSLNVDAIQTLDMLDRQTRHMTRLMDDLLDLSRITRGRLELRKEALDLRRCIDQAIELAQPRGGRPRDVQVRIASEMPTLYADPTRVTQIIGNLLHNAVKFAPPDTPIVVDAHRDGGDVLISVCDQGPGIDSAMLPGLFNPFNRPSDPAEIATKGGGLGIGLWLANRLAQLHGGRIEVIRPRTGGVEMVVRLPGRREGGKE